jgi:hypothetical protein
MCGEADFGALALSMTRIGLSLGAMVSIAVAMRYRARLEQTASALTAAMRRRFAPAPSLR